MYLYVPFQESEKDLLKNIPEKLSKLTGRLDKVMELELSPDRELARAKVEDVINALEEQGYYIQMPSHDILCKESSMLRDDSDTF
jgi:uncharacterized protein YcgL (UPF0745 family)